MFNENTTEQILRNLGKKLRGFEFISEEQWNKDAPETDKPAKLPKRSTSRCAGYDFFSPISFTLKPGESIKIPTGIKAYMQDDEVLFIYPRSGLGFKYFVRLANSTGIIDCDFHNNPNTEGHIWVKIRNEGDVPMNVEVGDAFCQGIFQKYLLVDGDDFSGNKREGGLGSTDKK